MPFPQCPVAHDQAVELEQLERGDEQGRSRGQQLGAPLFLEAGHAPALRCLGVHDPLVQGLDIGAGRRAAHSCSAGIVRSPDCKATAIRTRSFSVPLVPTASCGLRLADLVDEPGQAGPHPLVEAGRGRRATAGLRARTPR